jgi:hypothetical protein
VKASLFSASGAKDIEPKAPRGLVLSLQCVTPEIKSVQIAGHTVYLMHEEYEQLKFVADDGRSRRFCDIRLTLSNTTDTTYIVSSISWYSLFAHGLEFTDASGRAWTLRDTVIPFEPVLTMYTIPAIARGERQWIHRLSFFEFVPLDAPAGGARPEFPEFVEFRVEGGLTVQARPLGGAALGPPIEVPIMGAGRVPVSTRGCP